MTQTGPRSGYCQPDDLLIGDVPFPTYITPEQVIGAAADEIDSHLGFTYQVPIVTQSPEGTDPDKQIPSVVGLTLKRINASLASGRAILQMASSEEDTRLHAYGYNLVKESLEALKSIASGQIVLDNVPTTGGEEFASNAPLISNLDAESNVEAFYNRIANPGYSYGPSVPFGGGYW